MSAVREKKYSDSADTMVISLSEFLRICLARVTPEIAFPIMTICYIFKTVNLYVEVNENFLKGFLNFE